MPKTGGSTPPPPLPSGKGTLPVTVNGVQKGCVISGGTWYTTGTCASFTATAAGMFSHVCSLWQSLMSQQGLVSLSLQAKGSAPSSITCLHARQLSRLQQFSRYVAHLFLVLQIRSFIDLLFLLMIRILLQLVNGHVAYNGNPTWYANGIPSGTTQATISATTLSTSLTFDFVAS